MAFDPVPYRTELIDPRTGQMSRAWVRFFDQLIQPETVNAAWQNWTPTITAGGTMAIFPPTFNDAQYKQIEDVVFFKLWCSFIVAAPASNIIFVTLPVPAVGVLSGCTPIIRPAGGTWIPSWGFCDPAGNLLKLQMPNEVNFPVGGTMQVLVEGFYRAG